MLFAIGNCLQLHDYMNFRSVNTRFRLEVRLEAPPIPWTNAALEGFLKVIILYRRCLCFVERVTVFANFIDLRGEKYPREILNNQLKNITRGYSREDRFLMIQERMTVFLWNPFLGKTIQLPKLPHEGLPICCVSFSSSIDRVVLIGYNHSYDYVDYIFLEEGEWHSFIQLT
ncbi:hypothetical protein SLE2022_017920 [Rubroshorea leprosula]